MTEADLVARVQSLLDDKQTDRALDVMFRWVDSDLKTTRGLRTSAMLPLVDVDQIDEDIIVGYLVASGWGRGMILTRPDFIERCRVRLSALIVDQREAADLIRGLE